MWFSVVTGVVGDQPTILIFKDSRDLYDSVLMSGILEDRLSVILVDLGRRVSCSREFKEEVLKMEGNQYLFQIKIFLNFLPSLFWFS